MSSDEQRPIRQRRRALNLSDSDIPPETERDIFDPGPIVHYPPLPVGQDGLPVAREVRLRIRELRACDRQAAMEFILRTLHSYLVAHRPMDEIARSFGVTVRAVYVWRTELYRRIGAELRAKTPVDLIAKQIASLEEAKATAWQDLRRSRDHGERNKSLNTILATEKLIADMYARIGLINASTLPPSANDSEDEDSKARIIQKLAESFLEGASTKKGKKEEPKTIEQDISAPIDDSDFLL